MPEKGWTYKLSQDLSFKTFSAGQNPREIIP